MRVQAFRLWIDVVLCSMNPKPDVYLHVLFGSSTRSRSFAITMFLLHFSLLRLRFVHLNLLYHSYLLWNAYASLLLLIFVWNPIFFLSCWCCCALRWYYMYFYWNFCWCCCCCLSCCCCQDKFHFHFVNVPDVTQCTVTTKLFQLADD